MTHKLRNLVGRDLYEVDKEFLDRYPDDDFGWDGRNPFIREMVRQSRPGLVIEVGTWKGQSAFNMVEECDIHGLEAHIVCVDTWLGAAEHWCDHQWQMGFKNGSPHIYEVFLANVVRRGYTEKITPLRTTASVGAEVLTRLGAKAQLIYLDASHLQRDVAVDIECYVPLLADDGIIFGHDFGDHAPGVQMAVQQYCYDTGRGFHVDSGFWVLD